MSDPKQDFDDDEVDDDESALVDDDVAGEVESDSDTSEVINIESSYHAKEVERQRLAAQVEAFLKSGGVINQVPSSAMSDPPRKPESNYGGQPI